MTIVPTRKLERYRLLIINVIHATDLAFTIYTLIGLRTMEFIYSVVDHKKKKKTLALQVDRSQRSSEAYIAPLTL